MSDILTEVNPGTTAPVIESDAHLAYETVMKRLLITPNYLYLERGFTAPDFKLTAPGIKGVGITEALNLVRELKSAFYDLGYAPHTSDLLISLDGSRIVCVDDQFVTLQRPITLPDGTAFTAVGHLYHLRAAHRVTTRRGLITDWTISFDCEPAHLRSLLRAP